MTHGLLLIDKPARMTSHDVVARTRRLLGTRAVGHAGTLDPMATGLLILFANNATRLSEYVLGADKTYEATVKLGERTNTDDAEGEVVQTRPVQVTAEQAQTAAAQFIGQIEQIPPQFSAISKNGVRAYALARKGETVELDSRRVVIHRLDVALAGADTLRLSVDCGSGTYIRALARDLGEALGCGAHLSALRRTRVGAFDVREAAPLDALTPEQAQARLLPMDLAAQHFPRADLSADQAQKFTRGIAISPFPAGGDGSGLRRVYDSAGRFMAVGEYDPAAQKLRPVKVLVHE
ncbi:MAG TPA: tRNA pseudouridine(55) synthase TruB [Thermoflexales bacterium]|nr:tRNA pseudouridine(55) synthase TruB [Thermoflexales bacterium]HQW34076.1 tRNA pseudouridine(55) synthase TruB [Thermoflexales bacterium]HQZ99640.1 tRNA pseudouridine(55) synthase TruB [Thermoflexales bacterium]